MKELAMNLLAQALGGALAGLPLGLIGRAWLKKVNLRLEESNRKAREARLAGRRPI